MNEIDNILFEKYKDIIETQKALIENNKKNN